MALRTELTFSDDAEITWNKKFQTIDPVQALPSHHRTVGVIKTYGHIQQTLIRGLLCAKRCAWPWDCKVEHVTFLLTHPISLDLYRFLPSLPRCGGDWGLLARVML